jgi:hypothetical protein
MQTLIMFYQFLLEVEDKKVFCMLKRHKIKEYKGVEVKLHPFLNSILDGVLGC